MRRITLVCGLIACALGSCASTGADEFAVPAALAKYADIARFLLPGHSSLLFAHANMMPFAEFDDATTNGLVARCGSDFELPHDAGAGARYRGVVVVDHGPGGLGAETPQGEPTSIAGAPAWHVRAEDTVDRYVLEQWIAHVDGRYVVISYDKQLLECALARTGDLAALLRPFAAVHALPDDVEAVVCLLPRPQDRYYKLPIPVEATVACASAGATRLQLFHSQPLPAEFLVADRLLASPPVQTHRAGFLVTEMVLDRSDNTRDTLALVLLAYFGFAIFF